MYSKEKALELLKKHNTPERTINHSIWVGEIALEIATKINNIHPKLNINAEKVMMWWYLHDIWKSRTWDHEFNSVDILKEEWLDEIADIIFHWTWYEYFKLQWIERPELLPKNLENKIVCISDCYYNQNMQRVTLKQRFDDIFSRYTDIEVIERVKISLPRMIEMEEEINKLLNN